MLNNLILLAALCGSVFAACPDPSTWMEEINDQVIDAVQSTGTDEAKAEQIALIFKPSLDIEKFTKKIVGRTQWQAASPKQRALLQKNLYGVMLKEYTESLVHTLASKPKVYRVRGGDNDALRTVTVAFHTQREKILLANFSVECENHSWKIYDIMVSGVRLSDLQQQKFKDIVQRSGVHGLNEYLTTH